MSVSADDWDGNHDGFQSARLVRARKPHQCHACELKIMPGDHYTRDAYGGGDYAVTVTRRCARCEWIYQDLRRRMAWPEFPDERLACGHEFQEKWGKPPPDYLAALAFWLPGEPLPPTIGCGSGAGCDRDHWLRDSCSHGPQRKPSADRPCSEVEQ